MKAEDIKKCVKELNIGPDADLAELKKTLVAKLTEGSGDICESVDALGELNVELSERLSQVTDENRQAELERQLKLVEEAEKELDAIAKSAPAEPEKQQSVLIPEKEESPEDQKLNRPVAVKADEKAEKKKPAEKKASSKAKGAGEKVGLFSKKKDPEKEEKDKEKELEKKADELIKKRKQEQEAAKKRQAEAQKAKAAQDKNSSDKDTDAQGDDKKDTAQPDAGAAPAQKGKRTTVGGMDSRLAAALKLYHDRKYAKAREELNALANAKDMSRKDQGIAKFFYGQMIDRGEGGPQDDAEAMFWMEEAAKCKNFDALMWVGRTLAETKASSAEESVKLTARALKYFKKADKAAPSGNEIAKKKYVEICENMPIYRSAKKQALTYCDELAESKRDAYEKKQYEDKKEAIKENYKNNYAGKFTGGGVWVKNTRDVFVLLGALLSILGDYAIFMTLQNKGDSLPSPFLLNGPVANLFRFILGPLSEAVTGIVAGITEEFSGSYVELVLPGALLSGTLLFALGRLFIGLESASNRGRFTEIICEIAAVATLFTIFGNIAAYVFTGGSSLYFYGAMAVGILMFGIVVAAAIVTSFFRD